MFLSDLQARTSAAADECRSRGITQAQIADALGASQSQVSRILSGQPQRKSRLAEEVCLYVERFVDGGISAEAVKKNRDLVEALQSVWDGSAGHAKALSTVIRSLGTLRNPVITRRASGKQRGAR